MKKSIKIGIYLAFTLMLAAVLASPVVAADTSCKTKNPIILAHGMAFYPTTTLPTSFEGIWQGLKACGADIIITTVAPIESSQVKAGQFVDGYTDQFGRKYMGFNQIKALYPAGTKFNIIGHSQGGLYTRYAISNLGIAPYVASLTTVDSPHRGSFIGTLSLAIVKLIPSYANIIAAASPWAPSTDPVEIAKLNRNNSGLTIDYMTRVFNPNTPNKAGILYQSWTVAYKQYDIWGSIVYGIQQLINYIMGVQANRPNPADGLACFKALAGTFPYLAAEAYMLGGGLGDGLVQVSSAKWGNFLSLQQGPSYNRKGLNHFDATNINVGATWDAVGYWKSTVVDLKAKGY